MTGLLTAGILAAIMSSLDSQFVCIGSMFTNDIVLHAKGRDRFSEGQIVLLGRGFIVLVIAVTFVLSLFPPPKVFDLGVWCFSGFASLFPVVFAAVYWKRATKAGVITSILATAVTWFVFFYDGLLKEIIYFLRHPDETPTPGGGDYLIWGMMPVAIIFTVSALTLVVVSLLTRPPAAATIDKFFDPEGD